MPLSSVQGQDHAISLLRRMASRGRVPGALLFLGASHVGKRTAALMLAQVLNCGRVPSAPTAAEAADAYDACGECDPCRQIASGNHPDVDVVAPDGHFLKIDQIRAVTERLGLNPLSARRRVVVLAQAERLNHQAANAFLKTLEEPPADTTLILCATEAAALPETIVSRCLPVRFVPLADDVLVRLLRAQLDAAGTKRRKAETPALEGPALDFAVRFAQGSLRPELKDRAAEWYALRDELMAALTELPAGGDLVGERLTRFSAKEESGFVLEWLETWWRDVAVLAAGGPAERLINADRRDTLAAWPEKVGVAEALACHRAVLATRDAQTLFVNGALALEGLWLTFKHTLQAAPAR
jgi:DNA polymerase III subunit delta'